MSRIIRNIIVIGAGLHFRERHFKAIEDIINSGELTIHLVVDLISEKEKILNFFSDKPTNPKNYLFLPELYRNLVTINEIERLVRSKIDLSNIEGVMICTEPKAHKAYILWAIENSLHIFCDKPLTAFASYKEMNKLYGDYIDIIKAIEKKRVNFVLCCERRGHIGYEYIKNYVGKIIKNYRVPITFIDIHYGDGLWNMPNEYFCRENHPYKYGYGVLLHSGYHYIDLLMSFVSLNKEIFPDLNLKDVNILLSNPYNFLNAIGKEVYSNILMTNEFDNYFDNKKTESMKLLGETDCIITGRFSNNKSIITNFSMKLLQSTVTKRNWHALPENTYLNNGRVHQENVIIHIGPLCSIHIRINPYKMLSPENNEIEDFTVDIFNNPNILKSEPLIKINRAYLSQIFPDLELKDSLNISSRKRQLIDFLKGNDGGSFLLSHKDSIVMLDYIYKIIQNQLLNQDHQLHRKEQTRPVKNELV